MSRNRIFLYNTTAVVSIGLGCALWFVTSAREDRRTQNLKQKFESDAQRMNASSHTALLMQKLKEAAETNENLARGPAK